jgi:hypothetical protein
MNDDGRDRRAVHFGRTRILVVRNHQALRFRPTENTHLPGDISLAAGQQKSRRKGNDKDRPVDDGLFRHFANCASALDFYWFG